MRALKKKNKGLTLIELIIVLALTPVILGVIYNAVEVGYKLFYNGMNLNKVQEQSKALLNTLNHQLKNSRYYIDTPSDASDVELDNRFGALAGEEICYIEGYDGKMYVYSLIDNGGKKELVLYTSTVKEDNYEVDGAEQRVSETDYRILGGDLTADPKLVTDQYEQNRLKYTEAEFPIKVHGINIGYTPEYILYDQFEWKMFLYAKNTAGQYVRMPLKVRTEDDLTMFTSKTIMKSIKEVEIKQDKKNSKKCHIRIKAEEGGKIKELKTDVYVFERV